MITNHTNLLEQLREYIDEYVAYLGSYSSNANEDTNRSLRRIIAELEELQKHPDQPGYAARTAEGIGDQLERLRQLHTAVGRQRLSRPQQTLWQSFQDYIESEVSYLARVGSYPKREQLNVLLGDVIADLRALALHPDDAQAEQLSADLERKRAQLSKLERPWQQLQP